MMDYSYVETSVKRKETASTYAIRVLMILAAVLSLVFSVGRLLGLIISAAVIIAVIYFFPQLKVDYEYIFVDGQLDFDRILGGNKRKHDLRIDFEQVEVMAIEGSHALDPYKNASLKVKDYSSRNTDIKPYVIIYRKGDTAYRILFEPSERMVEAIRQKAPRKVVDY
ncbi:MAG: hypothetical protein GX323_05800 [Clostridiales bacterium]|nr:hypothetical protein [Clostridiales bacterium]